MHSPRSAPSVLAGTLLAALCLIVSGCGGTETDGPARTEQRGVPSFHSIELRGAGEFDVLVGPSQSVVIEASPATLARTTTTVEKETLIVDMKPSLSFWRSSSGRSKLRITLPKLNSLALEGAGSITVNGLAGGATSIVISGAGDLEASGTLDTLTLRMNGAGNGDLQRLVATNATVSVNGAGSVKVNATGLLDATVNGVGSISYTGTPRQLNTAINGVGSIARE